MNGAVEGERKERCLHVFVYTCYMQKSVPQQCLPPKFYTAGMLTNSQTHIHKHKYSCVIIQQFSVHACKYVHVVVVDYRVEVDVFQCESTSDSSLINE